MREHFPGPDGREGFTAAVLVDRTLGGAVRVDSAWERACGR